MKVATLVALLALALPMGASAQHYSNNDLCDDILYSRCDNPVIPSPSEPWDGEQRGDD